MELSKSLLQDLTTLGKSDALSNKAFAQLLDRAFDTSRPDSDQSSTDNQRGYIALKMFTTECIKLDSGDDEIRGTLEECEFETARTEMFLEKRRSKRAAPDSQLQCLQKISSLRHKRIVDVSWRLDYLIKMSQTEKYNKPMYVLEILTLAVYEGKGCYVGCYEPLRKIVAHKKAVAGIDYDPNTSEVSPLTIHCSLEQLQDFVGKLKDAVRCVERQVM